MATLNEHLRARYGSNYKDALKPVADASGLGTEDVKQDDNFFSNVGAGGYSLLNSALMGLPDFLVKNIGGEGGRKALEDLRKYHKTATDVGDVAGTIGSLLIPGGAVVKGLGLGAKAIGAAGAADKLGKAASFLKGGELTGNLAQKAATGALRGAGQAAEQGVVRGLTNLDLTDPERFNESAQESLGGLTSGIGIGALAGGTLGPLFNKILGKSKFKDTITGKDQEFGESGARFGIKELREKLDDATLSDAGIPTLGLKRAVMKTGYLNRADGANLIEDYKADIAKTIRDNGIRGKKGWEAFFDKNKQQWKDIDDAFAATNPDPKIWKPRLADNLAKDPEIQKWIDEASDSGIAYDMLGETMSAVAQKNSIGDIRNKLGNIIRDNIKSPDTDKLLKARSAMFLKQKIDDFIADNSLKSKAEIAEAKRNYRVLQPFLISDARDAVKLGQFFDAGPGTAEKAIAASIIGGGGVLGAGANVSQQMGQGGDFDLGQALQAGVAGSLIGGAAKKGIPAIGNKILASAGRGASKALESDKVRDILEKIVNVAERAPAIPGSLAVGAALGGDEGAEGLSDIPEIKGPESEGIQQGQEISTAPQISPRLKYILGNRLNYKYETEYAPQGVTPEQFMQAVQAKTKNFSDQEALAPLLYDDESEQANYLRQVQAHRDISGIDLDKALKGRGGLNILGATIGGDEEAGQQYDKLVSTILNLQNKGDILKRTDSQERQLKKVIAEVQKNPEMLQQLIESAGLDFKDLRDIGIL
jgi:hypothetical protein